MAVTLISKYQALIYGSQAGYMGARGQIMCFDNTGKLKGLVRFIDPGKTFPSDSEAGGKVKMHVPSDQFQNAMDILRNEKPVYIYFAQNRGFLSTSKEPVGEEET